MGPILNLTEAAAERVKVLIDAADSEAPILGLRVGIKNTGCSGMSYDVTYAHEKKKLEELVEDRGVKVFIEPTAIMFLMGATMDYRESRFESGFTFENPNAKSVCGCGESFAV